MIVRILIYILKLATKRYNKFKEKMELTDLFNKVIEDNTSFLKVKDFLNNSLSCKLNSHR